MSGWIAAAAWAWLAVWAGVVVFALIRVRARAGRIARTPAAPPPDGRAAAVRVLLIRPCAGNDRELARALASTASLTTRHELLVVPCVARASDPAWSSVASLAGATVAPTEHPNEKCGQLAAIVARHPEAEIIVNVDADVDLTGVSLDALVDPLLEPGGPAATYAPPIEVSTPMTLGDRASSAVLDSSLHAFPLLAGLDPRGFVGKLFAIRRDALTALGGFAGLAHHLGEDMELARRIRAGGGRTAAVGLVAHARASGRRWAAVVERYTRWIAVIRAQRPALLVSYPLLFFPMLPLLLASVATRDARIAVSAVVVRAAVAVGARWASRRPLDAGLPAAIVLSDLTLMAAFVGAVTRSTIAWRGRVLRLRPDGRIEPVA